MKSIIDFENPYMNLKLKIGNIERNEKAMLDTGSGFGVSFPQEFKNDIISEANKKNIRIFKSFILTADSRKCPTEVIYLNAKINGNEYTTSLIFMGKRFLIGRPLITKITTNPQFIVEGEKLEIII